MKGGRIGNFREICEDRKSARGQTSHSLEKGALEKRRLVIGTDFNLLKQMLLSVRSIKKKKVKEFSEFFASFRHLVVLEIRKVSSEQKKVSFSLLLLLHRCQSDSW